MYNKCPNIEDNICIIKSYDGTKWKYKGIVIGTNTPLMRFVSLFVKMNKINFSQKGENNETHTE